MIAALKRLFQRLRPRRKAAPFAKTVTTGVYQEVHGDLFGAAADYIAHGCNTKGVMGAGVAKVVRDKYPDFHRAYQELCRSTDPALLAGTAQVDHRYGVINLFTQVAPGPDARLDLIKRSLWDAHMQLPPEATMAIPRIGAGIGGLAWSDVAQVVRKFAQDSGRSVTVYYL